MGEEGWSREVWFEEEENSCVCDGNAARHFIRSVVHLGIRAVPLKPVSRSAEGKDAEFCDFVADNEKIHHMKNITLCLIIPHIYPQLQGYLKEKKYGRKLNKFNN